MEHKPQLRSSHVSTAEPRTVSTLEAGFQCNSQLQKHAFRYHAIANDAFVTSANFMLMPVRVRGAFDSRVFDYLSHNMAATLSTLR